MANLYPNIHFPKIDFSSLGDLPDVYRSAQEHRQLKDSLADLDSSDPKSLRAAAARAFAVGSRDGIEAGMRLSTAAQAQENLAQTRTRDAQRGAELQTTLEFLRNNRGGALPPVGGVAADPNEGLLPEAPAPRPQAPAQAPPQQQLTPQMLPPPPAGVPPMGARSEAPSASEQMLQAAEGPAPQERGPQLAGPLPTPDTPEPGGVPFLQGAQQFGQPMAPTRAPPESVPMGGSPAQQARAQATQLREKLMEIPNSKVMQSGYGQSLLREYTSSLANSQLKPEELSYQQENLRIKQQNLERAEQGLPQRPLLTRNDFERANKGHAIDYKAATDAATPYYEEEKRSNDVAQKSAKLQRIMNDPRFAAGESMPQALLDHTINLGAGIAETLRARGINVIDPAELRKITDPVALREAFRGISNELIISTVGKLGRATDKDVTLAGSTVPQIGNTSAGMQLKKDLIDATVEWTRGEAKAVSKYMNENRPNVTQEGVAEAVRKYNEGAGSVFFDEKGKPNSLGQRMLDEQRDNARREFGQSAAPASSRRVTPGQRGTINGKSVVIGPDGTPQAVD